MNNIDPYFYILNSIGFPHSSRTIEMPQNFSVYMLCHTEDARNIFIHTDRAEFNLCRKDDKDVLRLFFNLSKKLPECEKSIDIFDFYDDTELHKAHESKVGNNKIDVYRLRKNDLRLYMIFHDSDIVLFRLSVKREDKISKSEAKKINDRVKAICKYSTKSAEFKQRVKT